MYFEQFMTRYCGKKVDFDGAYGAQCVDLFRQYCRDVLDIPHTGAVEGAKDLYEKYSSLPLEKKYFTKRAKNTVPLYGTVAVWGGTEKNKYGHVAIVIAKIDNSTLIVFEQNGILQDGAKLVRRDTKNLLGYLEFKGGK